MITSVPHARPFDKVELKSLHYFLFWHPRIKQTNKLLSSKTESLECGNNARKWNIDVYISIYQSDDWCCCLCLNITFCVSNFNEVLSHCAALINVEKRIMMTKLQHVTYFIIRWLMTLTANVSVCPCHCKAQRMQKFPKAKKQTYLLTVGLGFQVSAWSHALCCESAQPVWNCTLPAWQQLCQWQGEPISVPRASHGWITLEIPYISELAADQPPLENGMVQQNWHIVNRL